MTGSSVAVLTLTLLGGLIALLGLFAAGDIVVTALGLGAIAAAGLIGVLERLATRSVPSTGVDPGSKESKVP